MSLGVVGIGYYQWLPGRSVPRQEAELRWPIWESKTKGHFGKSMGKCKFSSFEGKLWEYTTVRCNQPMATARVWGLLVSLLNHPFSKLVFLNQEANGRKCTMLEFVSSVHVQHKVIVSSIFVLKRKRVLLSVLSES